MSKEAHNHRPPSSRFEMKDNVDNNCSLVLHLSGSNRICKSGIRCINLRCQIVNRNKPRRLVNLTGKHRLSNEANILLASFFLTLLIFALLATYISCNNSLQRTTEQSIKLDAQKHDTSNPFLRALLTNQQFTSQLHNNQHLHYLHHDQNMGRNNNEFMARKMQLSPQNHHHHHIQSPINQMMVNSNQMPMPHIGHAQNLPPNLGVSESNSYNSIANLQDYPDRPQSGPQNNEQNNGADPNIGQNGAPPQVVAAAAVAAQTSANSANIVNDEPRSGFNEYQGDQISFEHNASIRNSNQNGIGTNQNLNDQSTNSRSSGPSDGYSRVEQIKPRDSSSSSNPLRSSMDPFEDIGGGSGLSTSEYERDLADLDEEFNRHTSYRRPVTPGAMVSDSYMSLSPDRYEARRYNRRPSYDYSGDYLNTAGSISSIVPRAYQRSPPPHWPSSSPYSDNSDLWTDSNVDFSPLSSYVSPSQYSYRWRPRYQRVSAYPGAHPYLTASASEQHMHPGYNMIPSYTPPVPTETISIALSPLAAAAAAAASALAAADKSRHQNHHHWLTLPRITTTTTTNSINPAPTTSTSASNTHTQAIPPTAFQTAYIHRPNPYALSSMPIYAIAPRPTPQLAPSHHPPGPAASYLPYFHGGAPAIIAYRPTNVMPPASLLTAASFAYPLRLPVTTIPKAPSVAMTLNPTRSNSVRPFHSDLQYAESKSKTNLNNNNTSEVKGLVKGGTLTAMAKNLTRKMFGSSSQIRPQHVAPPANLTPSYDLFSQTQNSSSSSSSFNAGSPLLTV